jgi:hypothetical protein
MVLRLAPGSCRLVEGAKWHPLDGGYNEMREIVLGSHAFMSGGKRNAWSQLNGLNVAIPPILAIRRETEYPDLTGR